MTSKNNILCALHCTLYLINYSLICDIVPFQQLSQSKLRMWVELLECCPYQIQYTTAAFTTSLRQVAASLNQHQQHYVDRGCQHHWSVPPGCSVEEEGRTCACGEVIWKEGATALVPFEELVLADVSALPLESDNNEGATPNGVQKVLKTRPRKMNMYSRHAFDAEEGVEEKTGVVEVLDGYSAFSHGLQTAVLAANMVLSVSNVVTDAN